MAYLMAMVYLDMQMVVMKAHVRKRRLAYVLECMSVLLMVLWTVHCLEIPTKKNLAIQKAA